MSGSKRRRILLVGDDTSVSARLESLLAEQGHEARAFPSLADLLAALPANPPDLLIVTAGANTAAAPALAAKLSSACGSPFIVLTSSWDERDARAGAESGALAVLASSPANLAHCVPAICLALERHVELRVLRRRAELLGGALRRARTISAATGVLMERLKLDQQQAFESLRAAARARRCRLSEFAGTLLLALENLNTLQPIRNERGARLKREPRHGNATAES
jgi:AmiR/NasT family two-component response regulator